MPRNIHGVPAVLLALSIAALATDGAAAQTSRNRFSDHAGTQLPVIPPSASSTGSLQVGDLTRTYDLANASPGAKKPLVIVLHGGGGSSTQVANYTGWGELAAKKGFTVAFPNAVDGDWLIEPSALTNPNSNRDVRFLNKLVAELVGNGTADATKVFITGLSRGGMMTSVMACVKAELFAGAAPVISSAGQAFLDACRYVKPFPLLVMNGTEDPRIPYTGGAGRGPTSQSDLMSVPKFVEFWIGRNGCQPLPRRGQELPDLDPADKSTVTALAADCPRGRSVELWRVNGGGHQQPRRPAPSRNPTEATMGPQNHDIDGATVIWAFFERSIR